MTEQDALAVALAEASPRVVGIRAEAEAILAALPPDAHLFTVETLAQRLADWWADETGTREEPEQFREDAASMVKAAKEASDD